jgi:group I intron endonuclease
MNVEIKVEYMNCTGNETNVIYLILFENLKVYVGQTTMRLKDRIYSHKSSDKCRLVHNAIKKYKTFKVSILSSNLDINQLNLFESFFIKLFNSNNKDFGYNLDSGGLNRKASDETKHKMSEIKKGKIHADETKRKISESHIGIKPSDETKRKISELKKRDKLSSETIDKMRNAKIGKKMSDEAKRKMSEKRKGRVTSDVTKAKLSKKVKSIPDNIIFDSVLQAKKHYGIDKLHRYYNGKIHKKSGQTFVLINE